MSYTFQFGVLWDYWPYLAWGLWHAWWTSLPSIVLATALAQVPFRGAFNGEVPVDPLLYRFFEIIQVFGPAVKAVIHEKFGDGIMSAIDFELDIARKPDPKGDRVLITMDGKFLAYRKW